MRISFLQLTSLLFLLSSTPVALSAEPLHEQVESRTMPFSVNAKTSQQPRDTTAPPPHRIRMEALSSEKITTGSQAAGKQGAPRKIGINRGIQELATSTNLLKKLEWSTLPSGNKRASISITSPHAVGTRLGILVKNLPSGTIFRFYSQDSSTAIVVPAEEILDRLARNEKSGDKSENAQTYWGPFIEGEEVTLEIQLPAGVSEASLEISIPKISHIYSDPLSRSQFNKDTSDIGQSDSCELDVNCYSQWSDQANATAKMITVDSFYSYLCTGTLLNDMAGSLTPYFLSANHCVPNQTRASTLETFWFFRSSTCGGKSVNPNYQVLTSGAQLLYQSSTTDTSFMKLLSPPPGGAIFSGWTVTPTTTGENVIAIHHPSGDLQKISFGSIQGHSNCISLDSSGDMYCIATTPTQSSANHLSIGWTNGVTEGGSSGSGLFVKRGTNVYLVGQLHGGTSACGVHQSEQVDSYGRFDLAYLAALKQWLNPTEQAQSGWWWNASEPGRGYFIEVKNGRFYVASFLYNTSGVPVWYVTGPGNVSGKILAGTLNTYAGGQTLTGAYKSPAGPTSQGAMTITFSDSTHGTIAWPGGSVPIIRYEIATGSLSATPPSFQPETGWWWNAAEGGRGFSFEVQGEYLYIAGYMYDESGSPIWYVSGGKMAANNYYEGYWQRCANGQAMSETFHAATCSVMSNSSVSIRFFSTTSAVMTLPSGKSLYLTRFSF